MNRETRTVFLAMAAGMLGGIAPGILLADFGPPMAVRIAVALLPFTLLPLAIGWLNPTRWWMAGAALLAPVPLAAILLLTSLPLEISDLWTRAPLFLPPVLTLTFALLGKLIGQRLARRQV